MENWTELSNLRILGILAGFALLIYAFFRLRIIRSGRSDVWLLLLAGLALGGVSLFPNLASLPAEVLNLGEINGGRLITLLIAATVLTSIFLYRERSKNETRAIQFDQLARKVTLNEFLRSNPNTPQVDVAVIIPALNEAQNLKSLLPRIPSEISGKSVRAIVVDDGSADETSEVSIQGGALVAQNPFRRGGGAAIRVGYDLSEIVGAEVAVTMDADGQHLPEELPNLVQPILDHKATIVIGSRFLGESEKYSWIRLFGIRVFNGLINFLMGTKITDCTSGYRAFELKELKRTKLVQDQYHTAELIIDALKRGLKIEERPITVKSRMSGESKKGRNSIYALNFLRTVVKTWLR